jgi:hypothetical protein
VDAGLRAGRGRLLARGGEFFLGMRAMQRRHAGDQAQLTQHLPAMIIFRRSFQRVPIDGVTVRN